MMLSTSKMTLKHKLLVLTVSLMSVDASCPNIHSASDTMRMRDGYEETEYLLSQISHYVEMNCCMENESRATWQKLDTATSTWQPLKTDDDRLVFSNNGQVFGIKSSSLSDKGVFKCVGEKDGIIYSNVSRKFHLDVEPCDALARGPYPIAPLPCEATPIQIGGTVTLPCTGYFGCPTGAGRFVSWFVSRDTGDNASDWVPADTFSPRYKTETHVRDGSVISSNLTIRSVSSDDTSRLFRCLLASPQIIEGSTSLIVRLHGGEKQQPTPGDDSLAAINSMQIHLYVLLLISAVLITSFVTSLIACTMFCRIKKMSSLPKTKYLMDNV